MILLNATSNTPATNKITDMPEEIKGDMIRLFDMSDSPDDLLQGIRVMLIANMIESAFIDFHDSGQVIINGDHPYSIALMAVLTTKGIGALTAAQVPEEMWQETQ
jgi:hypothetical protein